MLAIFWIWNGQAVRVSNGVLNLNHLKIGTGLDHLNTERIWYSGPHFTGVY